jgi:hypothetical protein
VKDIVGNYMDCKRKIQLNIYREKEMYTRVFISLRKIKKKTVHKIMYMIKERKNKQK